MSKPLVDHPVAGLFPLATDDELAGLAADISAHGQIEKIDLYEGKILDGRNRYRACALAGIKPKFQEWEVNGVTPQDYVVAKNLHRRHLTIAQRAALGVKLLDYEREEAKERQRDSGRKFGRGQKVPPTAEEPISNKGEAAHRAAERVGVGRTSVLAAELIAKKSPQTFEKMERGEISVTAAATEAGIGTGTYTKRKPHKKFSAQEVQDSATPANNIDAAHFYTGLASNVLPVFDQIPQGELKGLIAKAEQACTWWSEILTALIHQEEEGQ